MTAAVRRMQAVDDSIFRDLNSFLYIGVIKPPIA
jgi:hypothetical protein